MTSVITFPFIHKPYSIDDKTSSYTVPAGSYARVTFMSGNCTYDAKDVFSAESYTQSLSAATNYYFSILHPMDFYTFTRSSSATASYHASSLTHGASTTTDSAAIGTGVTTFSVHGKDLEDVAIVHTTLFPANSPRILKVITAAASENWTITIQRFNGPVTLWVPPGTDLDGTSYHVELYYDLT